MPDTDTTNPITISDILAATDTTARHAVPHVRGTIRALTIRELLCLAQAHPGILEIVDPTSPKDVVELYLAIGRRGVVAMVSVSTGRPKWLVRLSSVGRLLHALVGVLDVTMGERPVEELFTERGCESADGDTQTSERQPGIRPGSRVMTMVRHVGEVSARLGIDALDLSPRRLAFTARTIAEVDRAARYSTYHAVAAGMGSEEAHKIMGEL